jgi:hypothetical protein
LRQARAATATGLSLAFSSNVLAGSLIVVSTTSYSAGTTSVADTRSNTYTSPAAQTYVSDANAEVRNHYAIAGSSGALTVNVTTGSGSELVLYISEWTGIDTTTPLLVASAGTTSATGTTVSAAATGTMAAGQKLIYAAMGHYGGTISITEGLTLVGENENGNSLPAGAAQYSITTGTGTVTPTWTIGSAVGWFTTRLVFKAAP